MFVAVNENNSPANGWRYRPTLQRWMDFRCVYYIIKVDNSSWKTSGLQNASKLRKEFWDTINNSKKVNINLLSEDDVQNYEIGDSKDVIMFIYVPMANREQKPVYINDDIFNGTFRRNYEGDYHCTRLQV